MFCIGGEVNPPMSLKCCVTLFFLSSCFIPLSPFLLKHGFSSLFSLHGKHIKTSAKYDQKLLMAMIT